MIVSRLSRKYLEHLAKQLKNRISYAKAQGRKEVSYAHMVEAYAKVTKLIQERKKHELIRTKIYSIRDTDSKRNMANMDMGQQ